MGNTILPVEARDLTSDRRVMRKRGSEKNYIYLSMRVENKKQEGKFCYGQIC
jgi:hypothetical protein